MVARTVEDGIRHADWLLAQGAPYEEVMAALDACARLPGAEPFMPGIQANKLTVMHVHQRGDEDIERALRDFIHAADTAAVRLIHRAGPIIAACAKSPRLAAQYLLPLIAELQAESAATHDEALVKTLDDARQVCERLGIAWK